MSESYARTDAERREKLRRLRCPGCNKPQRHQCEGRRDSAGQPRCSCIQCHGEAIRADLAMYTEPPVLAEAWAYIEQIRHREKLRTSYPAKPRIQTCEGPGCGRTVASRRYGPKRRYCSRACCKRAYRHRIKDRERAAAWLGIDPSQVIGGKLAPSGAESHQDGTRAPGAATRPPSAAREAMAARAERRAFDVFGLADLLDEEQGTE